mgnify:CR=1 FL=1
MQPGDLVAIVRTGGGMGALQSFTADKRQLAAAIERVKWNGNGRAVLPPPVGFATTVTRYRQPPPPRRGAAAIAGRILLWLLAVLAVIGTSLPSALRAFLLTLAVVDDLLPHLRPGHALILRSTIAPGTTDFAAGYIEQHRNLVAGEDLFVAHVPERIAAIVTGIAAGCTQAGAALVGGETAEHGDLMDADEYDLAATAVGVVEADTVLGLLAGSAVTALFIGALGARVRGRDSIIGLVMAFGLGLAVLFIHLYPGRTGTSFALLHTQLLGDFFGVRPHGALGVATLFFLVGGFSNLAAWEATQRRGGHWVDFARSRMQRLVRPVAVYVLVWIVAYTIGGGR